jgi:hypothetical protein
VREEAFRSGVVSELHFYMCCDGHAHEIDNCRGGALQECSVAWSSVRNSAFSLRPSKIHGNTGLL